LTLRILLIALAAYLLLPQLAGLEASGRALARARRWWLAPLVLALEAASLLAYGELVRTILAAGGRRVGRGLLQRATMAGYALGRTLPGGSLAALAVVAARLGDLGVPPATTAAAMVVLAALALRPALRHPQALGRVAERATALIVRGRLRRRLDPATVGGQVAQAAEGLRELTREPGLLGQAAGWAAANWLLDLAVLATITSALGPVGCRCGGCRWRTWWANGRRRCRSRLAVSVWWSRPRSRPWRPGACPPPWRPPVCWVGGWSATGSRSRPAWCC
jgi:uncharacterized membrane protein YbhN (UPF0104 family)